MTGSAEGDGGVPHGDVLATFAEAVLGEDDHALQAARARVIDAVGPDGLCDSAGIVATFNAIDRIADSTGIPLEDDKAAATTEMRVSLGIDSFGTAAE